MQHRATPQHSADVRPEPPPLCDGTSPLHSKQHSNTIAHSFQLVFQSRVRSGRSRRCVINKRKRALRNSNRHVRMHGTDQRFNTRTEAQSRSPSYSQSVLHWSGSRSLHNKRVALPVQMLTNAQSHNSSADNLAPKPVDVCGPSDLRTHVLSSRRRVR